MHDADDDGYVDSMNMRWCLIPISDNNYDYSHDNPDCVSKLQSQIKIKMKIMLVIMKIKMITYRRGAKAAVSEASNDAHFAPTSDPAAQLKFKFII